MFIVEAEIRIGWVPGGGGNTFLGQFQANVPGQGQGTALAGFGVNPPGTGQIPNPRIVFQSQVRQYIVAEAVPGITPGSENAIAISNIQTALSNIVTDFAGPGTPIITPAELAIIAGWSSGSP